MNKDKIKEVATQIVLLEKECQQGHKEAMLELEKLILSINWDEMIAVDEYIYKQKLLT